MHGAFFEASVWPWHVKILNVLGLSVAGGITCKPYLHCSTRKNDYGLKLYKVPKSQESLKETKQQVLAFFFWWLSGRLGQNTTGVGNPSVAQEWCGRAMLAFASTCVCVWGWSIWSFDKFSAGDVLWTGYLPAMCSYFAYIYIHVCIGMYWRKAWTSILEKS